MLLCVPRSWCVARSTASVRCFPTAARVSPPLCQEISETQFRQSSYVRDATIAGDCIVEMSASGAAEPVSTMTRGRYQELFWGTERFTPRTRMCLERAVGRALFGQKSDGWPLRSAVSHAVHELCAQGLDAPQVLAALGAVVEDAGRACEADRTSLVSGEPTWMSVRTRVLAIAGRQLREMFGSEREAVALAGVAATAR
jgi:hypothetical protein